MDNCLNHVKTGKVIQKLFAILKINQKSIINAIKAGMVLPTKIKEGFYNDLKTYSTDEKYRTQKEKKIARKGRTCRTHSYY